MCEDIDVTQEDLAVTFEQAREEAILNGWTQPMYSGRKEEMIMWMNYWAQMEEHDRKVAAGDTNPGRPIAPHRSA